MFRSITIFAAIGLVMIGSFAIAEDKPAIPVIPDIPKPLNVMPSKIKPVQSNEDELSKAAPEGNESSPAADNSQLEILSPRPEAGFQGDFGKNLSREDIGKAFSIESKKNSSGFRRNLALKLALTPLQSMPNNEKFPENIYGQRLNMLMNLGAIEDAANLYKLNESTPPSPLAAKAGIESLMASNKIALACLEQKTFDSSLKLDVPEFWERVSVFCQALLSPAAGNDDELRLANASRAYIEILKPTATSLEDINKLDVITTIVMLKLGLLDSFISTQDNLKKIDDKHLALLTKFAAPENTSLPIIAEALYRKIFSSDKALEFLKSLDKGDKIRDYATKPASIDFLKEYFKNPDSPALTDKLLEMAVGDSVKESLLYPLYTSPEMPFPESNKILSLRILALTNQNLPANLVTSAYGIDNVGKSEEISGEELLINFLLESTKSDDKDDPKTADTALLALSYANYPQKDVKNSYDNILSLTGFDNYVMHNADVLNDLKKIAKKKQEDQVVVRSLAIIDDLPLEKLHPAELYLILEALNSAGLNEETTYLTREVLGNRMKN